MKWIKHIISFCFSSLLLLLISCKPSEIKDSKAYFSYLANPENGLVKEKTVAGVKYKLKYLPQDYLAYTTLFKNTNNTSKEKDSVIKLYDNSVTFMLTVGPDENENFDITRLGVSDYKEFAERIEALSFHLQESINLNVNNNTYKPVIARMENINALEKSRNFMIVFNSEKNTQKDLRNSEMCFSYHDQLFNTGTNKFIFKTSDIKAIPVFKF
jgi:hypothetical protein